MPSYLFGEDTHHIEQSEIDSVTLTECWRRYAFHQPPAPDREPLRETRKRMMQRPGASPGLDLMSGVIGARQYTRREMIFIELAAEKRYNYSHIAAVLDRSDDAIRLYMIRNSLPRGYYVKGILMQHRSELRKILADVFAQYPD